jgi:hypothetical protein
MKIERKKGIKRVRITYNKKIFWLIIILFIILIGLIYTIVNTSNKKTDKGILECNNESKCVPASCCHAQSCINVEKAPICNKMVCSQECSSILDCGKGTCGCVNNKCQVIKK